MKTNRIVSFVVALFAALALFLSASPAVGATIVTITPVLAPNTTSPSWTAWKTNVLNGTVGDRDIVPTAYDPAGSNVQYNQVIVSPFPSWDGTANPTGAFAGELGNRAHGILEIKTDDNSTFSLSQVYENMSSTNGTGLSSSITFNSGSVFNSTIWGWSLGTDNIANTLDDTVYKTAFVGAGTAPIWKILYVGVGSAFDASLATGPSNQDKLDQIASYSLSKTNFDIVWTGGIVSGASGTATLTVVPEPTSLSLLALGTAGLLLRRHRKAA